jgi:hypothetical protein
MGRWVTVPSCPRSRPLVGLDVRTRAAAERLASDVRVDLISDRLVGALAPCNGGPFAVVAHPSHQGSRCAGALVLLGQADEDIGLALALFGGQVRHSRRVLLPAAMAAGLRIGEDSGIDADWRTGQHGEIERLLDRRGFSCWIFSGGGTDFMRTWAGDVYGLPPHRVIGSVGETDFRVGDDGPELVKSATVQVLDDGPQKPSSIHRHVGQRPIMAAGNTEGDLAMLQWTAASPGRTLQLVLHHTDDDREYAYDRDPILGSGTDQILAAAAEHKWTVIDMAAGWATIHPPTS